MAKQLRWRRAWEFFVQEFSGAGPTYNKGYGGRISGTRARINRVDEEFFWKLIRVLNSFGIKALKHNNLGTSQDARGDEFTVGGTWQASARTVNLIAKNPQILAHEFVHAMDYLERGHYSSASGELVASSVGYLLNCHYRAIYSPRWDIDYARRHGATAQTLKKYGEYVPKLFSQLVEIIDKA